jgi:hypothetical protein
LKPSDTTATPEKATTISVIGTLANSSHWTGIPVTPQLLTNNHDEQLCGLHLDYVSIEQIPDTMAPSGGGYTFQLQLLETNNCGLHSLNLTDGYITSMQA